jgi:hypothetical protein
VLPKNFDRHDDLKEETPYPLDFASGLGFDARLLENYHPKYQLHLHNIEQLQGLQTNHPVPASARTVTRAPFGRPNEDGGHFCPPSARTNREELRS